MVHQAEKDKRFYIANDDAERILTKVMKRQNFGYEVRDNLAQELERIVAREIQKDRKKRQ